MAEVVRSIKDQAAHDAALGILAGIDPQTGAVLTDPLTDDADTGEISAANGPLLDFSAAVPQEIAGTNLVNETSVDEVLSANTVQENAADSTAAGTATRSDADTGAVLTYSLTGDPGGRFAIHATGGAISVHDAAPSHSISVRGADQGTLVFDEDFTIAVTDPEEAPVAVGDYVMTNEGTPLVFAASALTGNDSDPDGDALTVTAVGNATHGTVLLLDGNITFTPDANFSGIAQFDYTASDGRGGSTTATVTVDVAPVADAPSLQATQFMHAVRKSAGEFLVNTATFNGQLNPSVTALTNGTFVVTWEDHSGQGGDAVPASIKAQIFTASGGKVGGEFLVNTATASTQRFPSVTALTNGAFVVTWEDSSGAGGDASADSIKAQVFDASGAKVGGELLVNTATANSQANPSITALTNGNFVVTWEDNSLQGGDASSTSIKAQMFNVSGNAVSTVGGEVLVNTATQNGQIAPAITALAGGGFVVTWSDASGQGGDASGFGIKAQMFDASGTKAGGEFLVNTATSSDQSTPSITALSTGGFIVAWNDGSGQGGDASGGSIKAQIFNAAGGKVGGEKLVNTQTVGSQNFPSITALSNGWFVVTWEDSSGLGGDASFDSIKAQVYDGNGTAIGVEFLVNTSTQSTQAVPSVAALANGSFVVTWQDQSGVGGDTTGAGIKAQVFALASTYEDTPMSLSVASALTDTDGSETLALAVSSIPVGATLSDGVHTFTATTGNTSLDIGSWTLGSLTLTPPLNFNGDFQLSFTATSTDTARLSTGQASSTAAMTQTINVSVTPLNDAPVAVADHLTASEDTPLNIPMALLTGNDSDVDGDALTVTTVGTATHGSAGLSNGIVTFTPTANFSGIAQFTYTVSDGQGGTATATATVDVAPVADSPTLQANAVGAQRIGSEFLVNTRTLGDQANPSITALANGNFVVTWDDGSGQGGDASGVGVKAQILDAAGNKQGGEFLVNTTTANNQFLSSIAALTSGGFVVAWQDFSGVGGDISGLGVKARVFDAFGTGGSEFLVNTTTANNQSNPSVTGLTNTNFVVTWEDSTGDASGAAIKAQIYNATGARVGGEFLVKTATLNGQNTPSITALANGAFVVTWADSSAQGGDTSGSGIKARVFDAFGTGGSEFLVNTTTTSNQANPSVTVLTNTNFVVTWDDGSSQGGDASGLSTKAQIFNASGGKVGSEFRVNTTTLNSQSVPSITALTNGSFVVTWEDASGQGGDASPDSIKAQVFDASGNKQGGEFLVNTATLNSQRTPSITALANGAFVVTWTDASAQGADASGLGTKAQIFMVATDNQNTLVPLNVAAAGPDTDGSETLAVTASSIPVGATLTDGVHTFTASTGSTSVDITSWALINLGITPPLNFAGNLQLAFNATATDHATLSTGAASDTKTVTQIVNVNVLPVNGVTDEVLSANTVQENAANGTVVGTVTGADLNPGAVLTYALTNDAGGRFAIDAATGVITVANGSLLDFETLPSHGIAVLATDQFGFSFNKIFTVNLTNVNEAPTNEVLSGGTVAENAANNTVVGTVTGSGDSDAGAVLTYSLTDNAGGRFAINANTGVITVANSSLLNFEAATSHPITARVTDQGGLFFEKTFTITVTNVNEAPTNEVLTGGTVAENAANGTVVGTVTGSDPDAGSVLTYSLTNNASGRFAIDAATGVITVANGTLLNFEAAASQTITARVTDQGGLVFDKSFSITVTDVNEAPTDEVLTGGTIAENAANGTVVGTVTGSDPDAGAVLTYSLTDNAGGRFAINAATGQITVANGALLDFETATSHGITARVTDQGGLFFDKSFTINVSNVNEAPTNAVLSGGTIAENAANGTVVGTVTGSDADAGSVLTYTLLDNAGGRFAVNANTGVITVANSSLLDFETATSYPVIVQVKDQGGLSLTKTFTIQLTNVNEAPTDAVLDNNSVQENSPAGRVVGTVTGVDPDAGSVLTYALTNNAGGRFAIDATTGVITVATDLIGTHASLDFELAKTHDVTVQVTDQGGLSFTKTLTINVVDVNERPTDELLSANTVPVDAPNGTVIGTVTSIDPDVGEDVLTRYTIVDSAGNPVVGGPFAIDAATGVTTVADSKQLATAHQVIVRATDKGLLTFDKTFLINLTSVRAVADHFTTNEDTPLVIPGPIMTANDIDPNHRATVTAVGNASHGTVVVSNGVVTFTPDAHYSGAAQFDYTISDGQGGTSTATDTIDVAPNLTAVADRIGAREDGPVLISAAALTANDTSTGGPLTVTAVGNATHGTVVLSNGDASFRPDANFSGIAQFDYTVSNAQGDTSTATVTVDVAPVADEPTLSVQQRLGDGEPGDVIEIGVSPVLDQPVMVTLKNGDSVVAWFETTDGLDTLKAQRFDASGNELGGQIVVDQIALSGTAWGFLGKSLVALSDGGFAVTWSDHSADFSQVPAPTATTLNAKIFDPNGHETTGIIPIAARSRPGFTQLFTTAQSAALTNGRFVVEWVMAAQFDDGDTRVKMQVFDNDGGIVGDEILLDNFANITGLTNGRFVAIWNGGSPGAVEGRAQIFDADGSKIGGEMLVSQGGQVTSVTALSASRFLVAWNDSGGQKAQIFDGDGSKIGGEILVSQEGQVTSVTALSAGRFLVAWNDPGGQEAQIFDDDGSKIGGVLQFSENSVSVRSITALTNGTFVVGWIEATGPLTDTINAQVYDRSGHKVGGQFAISTGVVAGYSTATRPDGGFVVSWSDREFSPASSVHDRVQTFPPPGGPTVAAINTPVPLNVAAALTDTDGSETLTLTVSGIPVGTTLSDGTRTFTVTDGRASVDISNWNFASLRVTPPLDFRGDLQVTFTATSTDTATLSTGPASDTTSVTQIIDILIAPDETLSNDTVAENSPKGTVVGTIIPDLPADVAVTYALTDDAGGRFAIDADTGVVTVGEVVLDYERAPQHQYAITVRATNSADGTTFDNTFTIRVTDVNESPTDIDFFPGTATVAENSPNGTPVGRLFGTDLDAGDVLTFSLTDDADKRFAVDAMTGVVTVADGTRLDFETATSYNIGARETDRGGLSRDINLLIHVTDVNEAPIGEVLTFVRSPVRKFSPDGTPVGTVKGSDPDAGDVLSYALTVNPKGNIPLADPDGIFAIDPQTGIITVADGASLAFSTAKSLGIAVKVTDRAGLSFESDFSIPLTNVTANADHLTADGNAVLGFATSALTANDFDAQEEDLTVTEVGKAFGGTVLLTNDTITFTPDNNFSGLAQFDYTASDEDGDTDTATVTIDVTPSPVISGTPGDDVLVGTAGADIFHSSAGNDTMTGNGGTDFYEFQSDLGQTTINNLAQDGASARGEIDFNNGMLKDNLWFEQKGNDLQIDLMGTPGHITVAGWYGSDPSAQVSHIRAADGSQLDSFGSQLQQLVSAMAAYSDAHPGFNPTTSAQAPNDPGLQNAIANAWH